MNYFSQDSRSGSGGAEGGNKFRGGGGGGGFNKRSFGGGGGSRGGAGGGGFNKRSFGGDGDGESGGFNKRSFGGGGGGFNKRSFGGGGGGGFGAPSMHPATCSDCNRSCEVPFRPTGNKPVFCSNCFQNHREDGPGQAPSFEKREFAPRPRSGGLNDRNDRNAGRPSFSDRKMHLSACDNCEDKFELPFKPTAGRPVYCNKCFKNAGDVEQKKPEIIKEQFDLLHEKLDKLIKLLLPVVSSNTVTSKVKKEEEEIKEEMPTPKKGAAKEEAPKKAEIKKEAPKKMTAKSTKKEAPKKAVAKKAPAAKKAKATKSAPKKTTKAKATPKKK